MRACLCATMCSETHTHTHKHATTTTAAAKVKRTHRIHFFGCDVHTQTQTHTHLISQICARTRHTKPLGAHTQYTITSCTHKHTTMSVCARVSAEAASTAESTAHTHRKHIVQLFWRARARRSCDRRAKNVYQNIYFIANSHGIRA